MLFRSKANSASRLIQRFFLLSQLSEHYGSGAETTLRKDFHIMNDPALTNRQGLEELVTSVDRETRQSFRGLKIKPDHVCGVSSKNVLVLLMYILMKNRQARDWGHDGKPLHEIDPKLMQLHHIFPFNFMINHKPALKVYTDADKTPADFRADVNDMANLTFLSLPKNVEIKDTPPWQYLPNETTKETRRAHFIPEDQELWKPERFNDFLAERRRLLAKSMTSLIKKLS